MSTPKDLAKLPVERLVTLMTQVLAEDLLPALKDDLQRQLDDWSGAHHDRIVKLTRDVERIAQAHKAHRDLHQATHTKTLANSSEGARWLQDHERRLQAVELAERTGQYPSPYPVRVEALPEIQAVLDAAKAWKDVYRTTIAGGAGRAGKADGHGFNQRIQLARAVETAERAGLL